MTATMPTANRDAAVLAFLCILLILLALCFGSFFVSLFHAWINDEQFSYGMLVPLIVVYLLWKQRSAAAEANSKPWKAGILLAMAGGALQVLASRSGTLLMSGIALVAILIGLSGFLGGADAAKRWAAPFALLLLMVPLPSYVMGQITWHLQAMASTVSGFLLEQIGVPVYQDGNLLRLPNYVLEVKQACSGSNSILSLVTLALVLGISTKEKWWKNVLLVAGALILAVAANVVRIVGTGLIARQWGNLAANETLHAGWGVAVFLVGALGLLAIRNLLRRPRCEPA